MVRTVLIIMAAIIVLWLLALLYLRKVWFYRDPQRVAPQEEGLVVAPADGQVIYIKRFENGQVVSEKLGSPIQVEEITKVPSYGDSGWIVGIYMSPLDVHFNYAPVAARVDKMVHTQARVNLPMVDLWEYIRITYLRRAIDLFSHRYRLVNERLTLFLDAGSLRLAMVEIADKFVNKIRSFTEVGALLKAGEKISFIDRGSQVDLVFFRDEIEFSVRVGEQVYGAVTIIARYTPDKQVSD
jgi:phosphatidylserine decarboxylase